MDLIPQLMRVGFTEYESKVYLALLRENPATGYQISKSAGVPRSMVYEALGRLSNRGAVLETSERRSTLFRPVPPDMLFDRLQEEQRTLIAELRQGLTPIYESTADDRVWSISGRQAVLAYAEDMVRRAEQEIYLVLNDIDLEALRAALCEQSRKELQVSALLTEKGELNCGSVAYHPPRESVQQELLGTLLVVIDRKEVLIAQGGREVSATITSNPNLVLIARQFVWMEMLTQRVRARLSPDLLERLDPEDRLMLET